jgi:hypothetical protein
MLEDWKNLGKSSNGKVEVSIWKDSYPSEGSLLLTLRYWIDGRLEKWEIGMLWLRNLF